jgi:hypothetical protein
VSDVAATASVQIIGSGAALPDWGVAAARIQKAAPARRAVRAARMDERHGSTENRAVSIAGQAVDPSSVLCRFLDEWLPGRRQVAGEWDGQASQGVWPGIAVDCDRRGLGVAAELRIGLDLAATPGYQDLLSFLPPDECEILLRGAGYTPAGHLAETGTTDPLLREWIRSWQPIALASGQRWRFAATRRRCAMWPARSASTPLSCAARWSLARASTAQPPPAARQSAL